MIRRASSLPVVAGTVALFLTTMALADVAPAAGPQVGDCVMFREGGAGWLLKAPTYWLKGSIAGIARERRMADVCPRLNKPLSAYTRADWALLAAATPCVDRDSDVREVAVLRIRVSVENWETPWSYQHGAAGWLFRGQFLDQTLKKGEVIDMDASWLEPCEAGS